MTAHPPIVTAEAVKAARDAFMDKEAALARARVDLAAERRRLPMTRVEKPYRFDGPDGELSLLDLFEGRRQLIVYRYFFQPGVADYPTGGCSGCGIFIDGVVHPAHLNARDVTFAIVSPAPQPEIRAYQRRMGWEHFPWYSLPEPDVWSIDFGVDEWFGLNVYLRDGDDVYHTYFVTGLSEGNPVEGMGNVWSLLEITPYGRQETTEDSPDGYPQTEPFAWYRLHDEYDETPSTDRS